MMTSLEGSARKGLHPLPSSNLQGSVLLLLIGWPWRYLQSDHGIDSSWYHRKGLATWPLRPLLLAGSNKYILKKGIVNKVTRP